MRPKWFNYATIITFVRILATPILFVVYYLPFNSAHMAAALIFGLAALSDWLDGYLARTMSLTTRFGAFLDPVADKILVAVVLVVIVDQRDIYFTVLPAAIILGREIVISALREWMAEVGRRASVAVNWIGKVKTTFQMLALFFLLMYQAPYTVWWQAIGIVLLYVSAGLTLWSMYIYIKIAWPDLTLDEES